MAKKRAEELEEQIETDLNKQTGIRGELINYIRAGFPVLYLHTSEEMRAMREIQRAVRVLAANGKARDLYFWSHTDGLIDEAKATNNDLSRDAQYEHPMEALDAIRKEADDRVYIFRDLHPFFVEPRVVRYVRDIANEFKQHRKTLIILSPVNNIPPELERDVTLVEFDLPGPEALKAVLGLFSDSAAGKKLAGDLPEDEQERIIEASRGLTTVEAENAIAKAFIEFGSHKTTPISRIVMKEKALAVKKSGILEYFEAKESASDVGGLNNLKHWMNERVKASFTKRAKEFGLPAPKGILLVGPPGCGKSLTAKAASNLLGVPLIRFDIGKVFQGLVGSSENNMRRALQTIDAVGNCVVFIDEMEKALAGTSGSGDNDSGVTRRVFGSFLTWMQEKESSSFVIATINQIESLPTELLRKGRFDEIFFVGLPDDKDREEIFKIQIRKRGRNPDEWKAKEIKELAEQSKAFSGAEIEQAVISGLFIAFSLGKELNRDHIWTAVERTTPLAKSRRAQVEKMVEWAKINAISASDMEELTDNQKLQRMLDF